MILKILGTTIATISHMMTFTRFRVRPYELHDLIEEVIAVPWKWLVARGLGEYGTNWFCVGCEY